MATLAPSARFAVPDHWTMDCNDHGKRFYELYHVVSATHKSVVLHSALHFESTLNVVKANAQLDAVCNAHAHGVDHLRNASTAPRRFVLGHAERGVFFNVGKGTAHRRIYFNEAIPVPVARSAPMTQALSDAIVPQSKQTEKQKKNNANKASKVIKKQKKKKEKNKEKKRDKERKGAQAAISG